MATEPMTAERAREMQKSVTERRSCFLTKIVMDMIVEIDEKIANIASKSSSVKMIVVNFNNVKQDMYEFSWAEIAALVEVSLKSRGFGMKLSENTPRSPHSALFDVSW